MKRLLTVVAMGFALATNLYAQEEPKLVVKPSARILVDSAARYSM
jgi:hypothetical protein